MQKCTRFLSSATIKKTHLADICKKDILNPNFLYSGLCVRIYDVRLFSFDDVKIDVPNAVDGQFGALFAEVEVDSSYCKKIENQWVLSLQKYYNQNTEYVKTELHRSRWSQNVHKSDIHNFFNNVLLTNCKYYVCVDGVNCTELKTN